ncbi:MAG: hypothetical protein SOY42_09740 [Clostridium sp.]|nr:hypothetical protein [Clostridium sp.]
MNFFKKNNNEDEFKIKEKKPLKKKTKIVLASVATILGLGILGGAISSSDTNNLAAQPNTKIESQNKAIENNKVASAKFKDLSEVKDNENKEISLDLKNIKSSDINISTSDEKVAKAEFKDNKWVVEGVSSGSTTLTIKDKNNKVLDTITLSIAKSDETIAKEAEEKAKKEEEERIAAEKAEQERIAKEKAEQERIAAEQAAQAEAERIAKEQAAQAEAQRIAQEQAQQAQLNKNQTVENVPENGEMVWKTATGSKYHRTNHCGNTNPNKATQITKEQAENMGLEPCKKCY